MAERRYQIVLCHDDRQQLSLEALASSSGLHPALVERFVEFGLLDPVEWAGTQLFFDVADVRRLRIIERLRHEVGINLTGIAVILDLLDRLRASQPESRQ